MTSSAAVAWIRSSDAVPRIVGRAPKHLSSWRTGRAGTSVGDGAADSVAGSDPGEGLGVDPAVDGPRDGVADSGVEPSWLHADTAITHTAAASHRLITAPFVPSRVSPPGRQETMAHLPEPHIACAAGTDPFRLQTACRRWHKTTGQYRCGENSLYFVKAPAPPTQRPGYGRRFAPSSPGPTS